MHWFLLTAGLVCAVISFLICVSGRGTGGVGSVAPFFLLWTSTLVVLFGLYGVV